MKAAAGSAEAKNGSSSTTPIPNLVLDRLRDQLARRGDGFAGVPSAIRDASFEVKRQTLEAFDVQVTYDRATGGITISAAITDAVAKAMEKEKALREEGFQVTVTDIAGAGFEPATFGL